MLQWIQAICAMASLVTAFLFPHFGWAPTVQAGVIGVLLIANGLDQVNRRKRIVILVCGCAMLPVAVIAGLLS